MDFGNARLYEIELWSQNGSRIADISHLCSNRHRTETRNDAEILTFDIDLFAFEKYCKTNLGGADPNTLIKPYATEVKLKRGGVYLYGYQVVDLRFSLNNSGGSIRTSGSSGSSEFPVSVTCTGYLNLFKDRYLTKNYVGVERTAIATDLITQTQLQANGGVGVTNNAAQYVTGMPSDRTYQLDNVKLKLQQLAALSDAPFDLSFSWDKVFTAVGKLGARRQDVTYVYGGPVNNVVGFSMARTGASLYNKIYGLGSGFGADQLQSIKSDPTSQVNYFVREQVAQFNSVVLQDTLDRNTQTALDQQKELLELPTITITGKDMPKGTPLTVGDRISLRVDAHPWLASVNGLYRIEQMDTTIDENDFETSIVLTFDNYGVNQSE